MAAGYKGYVLERRGTSTKVLVSPFGVEVASLIRFMGQSMAEVVDHVDGLTPRADYNSETEIIRDLADQHRRLEGEDDSDDPVMGCADARVIIKNTVTNYIQVNHNSLGVQMSGDQLQLQINEAIDNASSATLKKVLKEWIPQAVLGAGVSVLLSMLGAAA